MPITCVKCKEKITKEDICCGSFDREGKPIKPVCKKCHRPYHQKKDREWQQLGLALQAA